MRLKDIIRAPKTDIDVGAWKRKSKMPKSAFPLSKSSSYQIPSTFDGWCVVNFKALGASFRLLVAFDMAREEYRGWLGLVSGTDSVLLARYEFHGSHAGWHCHANCDDPNTVTSGVVKGFSDKRYPAPRSFHRKAQFDVTEMNALSVAYRFYGITVSDAESNGSLL